MVWRAPHFLIASEWDGLFIPNGATRKRCEWQRLRQILRTGGV